MRTLALLCLIAAAPSLVAQLAESLEVTLVEVPVTVHDRAGNTLRGLTRENFEVQVDGKKVPIEYFEAVDLAKVTAREKLPGAAYRNFLLLFDIANSVPGTTGRAQEAAKKFVQSQLSDRDLAAVATFTNEQGATLVTSFTRDKELLLGAIASLGDAQYFKTADPLLLSANYTERQGVAPVTGRRETTVRSEVLEESRAEHRTYNQQTATSYESEDRTRIRTQLQNFSAIARALDGLQGQKQIILLSEGFDAGALLGRQDLSQKNTRKENDAVLQGDMWDVEGDKRFGGSEHIAVVQAMVEAFRRSDVILHAIDIRGVRGTVDTRDGLQSNSNEGLFLLTRPTRGTVFRNDNDLSSQFGQLLAQQELVYVLGFRARDARPGAFHPLRVKLVGAKGEIAHRSGYYDERPEKSDLEATLEYAELLQTRAEVRDLPLTVTTLPLPGDEEARVAVIVDAAGPQFLEGIRGPAATATIFVYAFDGTGRVLDSAQQRVALDLAKTGETVTATGVRFIGSLRLPPGRATVKAMVRVDEIARIGLTTAALDIPKFGEEEVLTPVGIGSIGRWVTVLSRAHGGEAAQLVTLGQRPYIPLRRVEWSPGTEQEVALLLRGLDAETLEVQSSLVAADGSTSPLEVQLASRTEADEYGVAALVFRVPPQQLASGSYELRFTVGGTVVQLPVAVR
jgi:VWFA-related protein